MNKSEITYGESTAKTYAAEDTARKKALAVLHKVETAYTGFHQSDSGGVRFSIVPTKEGRYCILFFPSKEYVQAMIWEGAQKGHKIIY